MITYDTQQLVAARRPDHARFNPAASSMPSSINYIAHTRSLASLITRRATRALAVASLLFGTAAQAATITVNSSADPGVVNDNVCTLREAVGAINSQMDDANDCNADVSAGAYGTSDEVLLDVTGDIQLDAAAGEIVISKPVGIGIPDDADPVTIHGNNSAGNEHRIFNIGAGANTILSGLILTDGKTVALGAAGGAVYSQSDVTLFGTIVTDNATAGATAGGGGLFVDGDLAMVACAITDNSTAGPSSPGGGAVASGDVSAQIVTISGNHTSGNASQGGGLYVAGKTELVNTTISGNSTTGTNSAGGGLHSNGDVTLYNCTIAFNTSTSGTDAVFTDAGHLFTAWNSIIAQADKAEAGCGSPIDAGSENLAANPDASITSCGSMPHVEAVNLSDLKLQALANNLSVDKQPVFLQTHALKKGSVAIDAGNDSKCPMYDNRGVPRPQDGDGDFFVGCDIGSYEYTPGLDSSKNGGGGGEDDDDDGLPGGCTMAGTGNNGLGWLLLVMAGVLRLRRELRLASVNRQQAS